MEERVVYRVELSEEKLSEIQARLDQLGGSDLPTEIGYLARLAGDVGPLLAEIHRLRAENAKLTANLEAVAARLGELIRDL